MTPTAPRCEAQRSWRMGTSNARAAKQQAKQLIRRMIGEPYVGKRLKQRRVSCVLSALQLQPATVLDAGSEDATFVYWLANLYPGATVTGLDIDAQAVAACCAAQPAKYARRVRFETAMFSDLEPDSFDLITAFDVLEHIKDDRVAMTDLARALRPGGMLLVHVPRDRWTTWRGAVQRVPDEEAWRINVGHVRQGYSPESVCELLTGAGLRVEKTETWLGRWGVLAHEVYQRLEHPTPLRLLSIPVTDLCAWLDQRNSRPEGNTVFACAVKPG